MLNKKPNRRICVFIALILTFMMTFPIFAFGEAALSEPAEDEQPVLFAAAPEGETVEEYSDNVILYAAPDADAASDAEGDGVMAIAEAPEIAEDTMEVIPENGDLLLGTAAAPEETFTGNKIGQWLDRTFYKLDYAIFTAFSKLHNAVLTGFFNLYTHLGDTEFAIPMLVLGLILSFFKKTRKYGLTLFFAIIIGTLFTNVVLKNVCGRARPYVTLAGDENFMNWYTRVGANVESDNSFPSGHTTCAFEIAAALFLTVKNKKINWIFPVYAVLIMCSRIYLMVHYPTDVFVGVFVGIAAGAIGYVITKKMLGNEKIASFDLKEKIKK